MTSVIPELSVVVSVYNEEEILNEFYTILKSEIENLKITYEIIFVNDGSIDSSIDILKKLSDSDKKLKVIDFSRNFGHEAAMIAGIDYCTGNYVICMDSDLQHPPRLIAEMLSKANEGYDIINMVRLERKDGGLLKKITSKIFYKLLNNMASVRFEENASDFFLISKKVANILRTQYRERTRFLRGIIQIVGFNKTNIEFVAEERKAGKSKYNFLKLLRLSFTAVSSFSKMPLQLGIVAGIIFLVLSLVLLIYSIIMWSMHKTIPGYTTLIVFLSAFAGIQLFITGLIGQYIGYMFDEIKRRPIYSIGNTINIESNNSEIE
ncbi:MAG: glycosyltransferase family 2 protein [Bacteroidales bacterium]|jgi:dolichol-phosphate mannosyltransferase|nr:glycosyltransferase family 2 protein [Bacteroidales bacterium]